MGIMYLADTKVRDFSADEVEAALVLATMVGATIESDRARGELSRALARSRPEPGIQVETARPLGEGARGLARELSNVFAIILGMSRLLLARAHDTSLTDGLSSLEEAAWRGTGVVDRLTELASPVSVETVGLATHRAPASAGDAADPHGEAGATPPIPPAPAAAPAADVASILVLEDEEPVRSQLVSTLVQAGYRVEAAADGALGQARLEGGSFDVVLTSLALPQRSGLAIARSVKRLHPRTPVVLVTGWGHVLDPERLREHGVDLILVKPLRVERVLAVVRDALRLRSSPA